MRWEVRKLIERHPESHRCVNYQFRHRTKKEILAVRAASRPQRDRIEASAHGASRLEPYSRAKKKKLAGALATAASEGTEEPSKPRSVANGLPTNKVDTLDLDLAKQYRLMTSLNRSKDRPYEVKQSGIAGMGLYCKETIRRGPHCSRRSGTKPDPQCGGVCVGQMVTEYVGELIGNAISDRREELYEKIVAAPGVHRGRRA